MSSCNDISYMYFYSIVSIFPEELKNTIMLTFLNVKFNQPLAFNGITTKCPWILGTYLTFSVTVSKILSIFWSSTL